MQPFLKPRTEPTLNRLFIGRSAWPPHNGWMQLASPLPRAALPWRRLASVLALAWAASLPVHAPEREDHDRARAAVQAGEVLPLPELLARVQRSQPGRVLDVELEREDGRWLYELKLLRADGQRLKLLVDARSGEVLGSRARGDGRGPGPAASAAPAPALKRP